MELLQKIGDFIVTMTAWIERLITGFFGSSNERQIRQLGFTRDKAGSEQITPGSLLDKINQFEPTYEKLSDDELRQTATKLRARLAQGETLDDILPEAFAAVRESGKRQLKMRHYNVQMIGGFFLHKGMIAEMTTGEGKTLVATLPCFLNALAGSVHVVTVNDYLARRDMEWMGPLYMSLGLTVGAIQSNMNNVERRSAYACDITYGTNNEFGFDYLRDNMASDKEDQVQGPLVYAIVDEIDNILIDEARTPLIISGKVEQDTRRYGKADQIVRELKKDVDFEIKEKEHTCHLTEAGVRHAEQLAGVESFYTAGNMEWPHLLDNALKAHHLYKRDVNYVVQNGKVIIVDEFTGRLMDGRQWSDGLHQAVEAKEGVPIKDETQTLATITLQNYFKLYDKLCGMTGTAMTEAAEFWKIYKLDVVNIPTNRPMRRVNHPDVIFRTEREKWNAMVDEIRDVHKTGRPILVGTVSIEKSELLSSKLNKFGIKHNVLNAKHHEREAEIISQAGRWEAVTIATNMAGRGTDIILGGNPEFPAWEELSKRYANRLEVPKSEWDDVTNAIAEKEGMKAEGRKVADAGGLHVIGTERHEARRIDLQLRGRSGRQGDPGESRFFLSLEDDLMRIFAGDWVKNVLTSLGMKDGEAIESGMVTRRIEAAQKKVEERHFEMRKHLLDYDEVMDEQRKRVYSYRQRILDGGNCRILISEMIDRILKRWVPHFLSPTFSDKTVKDWAAQVIHLEVDTSQIHGMDKEQLAGFLKDEALTQAHELIQEQIDENLPEGEENESEWNWQALSKWANAHFGLNTNDREFRKIGRDDIEDYLRDRAEEAITRYDLTALDIFLAEDWGRQSLSSWLLQQFTLPIEPNEFDELTMDQAIHLVRGRVGKLYEDKEIEFPVVVGLTRFLMQKPDGSERYDREGLARWASTRFHSPINIDEFSKKSRNEIQELLSETSQKFLRSGESIETIRSLIDTAYPGYHEHNGSTQSESQGLDQLVEWVNSNLKANWKTGDLKSLTRDQMQIKVMEEYNLYYRPELSQAERSLILSILDTSWKDHLHTMDHLRSGIGLVGYAQKDPKVEYKREGMRTFELMWEQIAQQVTTAIFRLEKESPRFVGSLWNISSVRHDEVEQFAAPPSPADAPSPHQQQNQPLPGQNVEAIDPIRNTEPKVGRNDPCPCGSGKKYKKCHGAGA
ncbi:MAG: preprotein translocase subunit SecA [Planctomycetota bacterium]|nr:preprotein translocase subunit SecA [Planctomycetota bacterium]